MIEYAKHEASQFQIELVDPRQSLGSSRTQRLVLTPDPTIVTEPVQQPEHVVVVDFTWSVWLTSVGYLGDLDVTCYEWSNRYE